MLNFVLCDDNITYLNKLDKILEQLFIKDSFNAQVCFKSTQAREVLNYVKNHSVNVLILDINLKSDISGIELAEKVRQTNKNIYFIFTTGHLEYAMLAYQVKTFDYIPKPVTPERLETTLYRLFDDATQSPNRFINVGNKTLIKQDDIQYIKKDGMKLIFYTDKQHYEAYNSFIKMQEQLPSNFIRCHKSYIVNINNVSNVESSTNTVLFDGNNKCYIGPKYKNNFLEVFKNGNFSNNLDSNDNT